MISTQWKVREADTLRQEHEDAVEAAAAADLYYGDSEEGEGVEGRDGADDVPKPDGLKNPGQLKQMKSEWAALRDAGHFMERIGQHEGNAPNPGKEQALTETLPPPP